MEKLRKINKILIVTIILSLLLLVGGLTYAYFTANIEDEETGTTITVTGGTMNIVYNGGAGINISNVIPKEEALATKNITITGNNTTGLTMNYNLSLIVTSNNFSYDALKYKLISTNTGTNGTIIPSITTMQDIGSGARDILLGNGTFTGPTDGNKIHTYNLEIYFPDTGDNQNYDQGKTIETYVKIEQGTKTGQLYLTDAILNQFSGSSNINEADVSLFDTINTDTENKMYKMEDDYGMSYYYRGAKIHVNNNLIFAEHQWKIVRINGDGSIRIIYNGECPSGTCTINTTGGSTQIGTSVFNSNIDDNKYVGYMFGGTMGSASTSRLQATSNETSSTIKTYLDSWYVNNIQGTEYESYVSDILFCNDRQLESEVGGPATGTGFGASRTYYAAIQRLYNTKNPNIKCGQKNDRFTVSDTVKGNGALTYPIGLLTPDETAIAGLKSGTSNSSNYLYTNQVWWTSGPDHFRGSRAAAWGVFSCGSLDIDRVSIGGGARGVLNLNSSTQTTGTGSSSDPFKVV